MLCDYLIWRVIVVTMCMPITSQLNQNVYWDTPPFCRCMVVWEEWKVWSLRQVSLTLMKVSGSEACLSQNVRRHCPGLRVVRNHNLRASSGSFSPVTCLPQLRWTLSAGWVLQFFKAVSLPLLALFADYKDIGLSSQLDFYTSNAWNSLNSLVYTLIS